MDRHLAAGRAALHAGRWEDARAAFERALAEQETADALDGLAEAWWWLGEPTASVDYRQRAYVEFRRAGDTARAAMAAIGLSITYGANFGNAAAAAGWLARAERIAGDAAPGPLQGWLWLMRGYMTAEVDHARELLERALGFARRSGDVDLELVALADIGGKLVAAGQVQEGMELLDEALAGTLAGECRHLNTVVYTSCTMLGACDLAGDLERATQWCQVANDFIRAYGCPFLYAHCRTLYGSILVAKGHWAQAERELSAAVHMAEGAAPVVHAKAVLRLADLRLRQGRLEEAEALLSAVDDELLPTLTEAKIRLTRGEHAVAIALLDRRLAHGGHLVERASALGMLVEAHLARDDLDQARMVAAQLDVLADTDGHPQVVALATLADAGVSSATGRFDDARRQLEAALDRFTYLDLPWEAACVRLQLAHAVVDQHPELAVAEATRALAAFDRIGATRDADAAAALLRRLKVTRTGPRGSGLLTRREQEVLRLIGLGLSNPEIAERLFISRKTASHHVSNLLAKLGLRNRAEAVAYAALKSSAPY